MDKHPSLPPEDLQAGHRYEVQPARHWTGAQLKPGDYLILAVDITRREFYVEGAHGAHSGPWWSELHRFYPI